MIKPICIYHAGCSDGFGAAWVVHTALKGDVELFPAKYGDAPPDVLNRDVYIVDFSYKRPVLLEMAKQASNIVIIDHHETAEADLKEIGVEAEHGNIQAIFNMAHSGAMLTWQYFFCDEKPPLLLRHIEDRDLWKFQIPYTREVIAGLFSYDFSIETFDRLMFSCISLQAEGETLLRQHDKNVDSVIRATERTMYIGGIAVPVANAPHFMASDIGNKLSRGKPFAATYFDTTDGKRSFSLRSQHDGENVADIAKRYGGGGHAHAAGFSVPLSDLAQFEVIAK